MTEWRPISGYEGIYDISDDGRVYARKLGREKALLRHTDGYSMLRLSNRGAERQFFVHRLVCSAFNGPPNALHREVAHLNGNRTDNRPENLKWVSPAENNTHKLGHGTHQAGELHPRVKLTREQVGFARASSLSNMALGRKFGVHESAIRKIRAGQRWREPGSEGMRPNTMGVP